MAGWGTHRSTAYKFPKSVIGNPWTSFNVEQQASLMESWFMPERDRIRPAEPGHVFISDFGDGVTGGDRSPWDPRFPYIRDVIRARNRGGAYRPVTLPGGGDPQVKAIQNRLVALGYLKARHARRQTGARRMIRALATAALFLTACSRSTGGPLDPVEAPGVRLSKDADGGRAATVDAGAVSARVTARWSDTGGQSAMLVYANRGRTPVRMELGTLTMTGPAGEAVVMSAADVTDTDLLDNRTDNDDARPLLRRDDAGTASGGLDVPPGAQRRVDAQLSPFSNTSAAAAGNGITLRVPMPDGTRDIAFVARQPSLLPY